MRTEPDNIYPELLEIIQVFCNPGQVSDAVAIRVLKRTRVYLVDDRLLPPRALDRARRRAQRRSGFCRLLLPHRREHYTPNKRMQETDFYLQFSYYIAQALRSQRPGRVSG